MHDPSSIPEPRAAATVLLLRDEEDGGFSVFMVQRSMQSSFMPGAFVFPGGKVEPEDSVGTLDLEDAVLEARFGGSLDAAAAGAYLRAAVREVEEEAGVVLPDPTGIQPFSHWITPEIEARRFDTWFFVARMPEDACPVHDDYETVASAWIEPRMALARYGEGELLVAPPTYYTLWDLARFETAEDVFTDVGQRQIVAVQPRFEEIDGRWTILLPGDPLYPSEQGVEGPSRIVMGEGGRWWVVDSVV